MACDPDAANKLSFPLPLKAPCDCLIVLGFNLCRSICVVEIVDMKERDREERGTGMKVKKEEIKAFFLYPLPATRIAGLAQL